MMEQDVMGKLLPNLKITVGTDSDDQVEEGEISDIVLVSENSAPESEPKKNVDVVRSWMKTLQTSKLYENKDGGFITGLDLSSEVLLKKLEKRAERFGLEKKDGPITQKEIDDLYKSLGIEPENLNSCKLQNIRLESLHMRGVNDMSTNDIFSYFGDYGPSSVEWINDVSCNVVWLDAATTARALIGTSRSLVLKKKGVAKQESTELASEETVSQTSEIEAVIEMSDSETDVDKNETDEMEEIPMEVDEDTDDSKPPDNEAKKDNSPKEESEIVDVPVPPGYWRLGLPHPKTKTILLRFATKDDKKLPGAEKRSQYYQKYGNPNYGGLKGLISSSRKRKIQAARNRQAVENLTDDSKSQQEIDEPVNVDGITNKPVRPRRIKMPRMRMYADDEEKKKRTTTQYSKSRSGSRSIHSRLGKRYSRDDLQHLGHVFSSASEDEDDNIPINCTVPARYNVWTDIAQSMSREEGLRSRSSLRSKDSRNFRGYSSSGLRSSRNLESYQDSRSRVSSSNRSSQDLRSTLRSSQRRESFPKKQEEDLRSKIRRLRKENPTKHRSPMYMDN